MHLTGQTNRWQTNDRGHSESLAAWAQGLLILRRRLWTRYYHNKMPCSHGSNSTGSCRVNPLSAVSVVGGLWSNKQTWTCKQSTITKMLECNTGRYWLIFWTHSFGWLKWCTKCENFFVASIIPFVSFLHYWLYKLSENLDSLFLFELNFVPGVHLMISQHWYR